MPHKSLIYQLNGSIAQQWSDVNRALACLAQSNRVWLIEAETTTYDFKRNSGSSSLIDRKPAVITLRQSEFVSCNLNPYCIQAGMQRIFFLPDRLVLCRYNNYVAVYYSDLTLDVSTVSFIEEDQPPTDAPTVGSTWRYVNKDGSPDLRFMDNWPLPVMEYATVILASSHIPPLQIYVSSVGVAQTFADIMRRVQQYPSQAAQANTKENKGPQQNCHIQESSSAQNCYNTLNVSPQCTLEEASVAYREMAKQYHPDTVCRLAPEFRALAHERMVAINEAYAEIKRLRALCNEGVAQTSGYAVSETANSSIVLQTKPRLIGLEGAVAGKVYELDVPHIVIGRDEGCNIRLFADTTVSRRHAYIVKKDGCHVVHDNASTNGTLINGGRLSAQILRPGDIVQFGNSKFRFE